MMKIIFSNHHVCWFKKIIYYTFIIALSLFCKVKIFYVFIFSKIYFCLNIYFEKTKDKINIPT